MYDLVARRLDLLGPNVSTFSSRCAVTYVRWIVQHINEPGVSLRNTRFVKDAQDLCAARLAQNKAPDKAIQGG